ncbi:MAG: DUF896 domain-containing protein [Desulfurispora sp.]|uniref:DUF896 domain-containing protein n=1 Tax=Desulfurispora sp. TaxID=3014275 RepID=UPI00404B1ADC
MITRELIDRINELARKQRSAGLTAAEKQEQDRLRRQYLDGIRAQVVGQLEAMGFKPRQADGRPAPARGGGPGTTGHPAHPDCGCSCCHAAEKDRPRLRLVHSSSTRVRKARRSN